MLPITSLYAALLGFYFVWLATRVIKARRQYKLALGTSQRLVERAVRAHGNFAEYVPFALLLMALLEISNLPDWALHVLGTGLVVGRVMHATGIAREPETFFWRVTGTSLTFTVILLGSAALLALSLPMLRM